MVSLIFKFHHTTYACEERKSLHGNGIYILMQLEVSYDQLRHTNLILIEPSNNEDEKLSKETEKPLVSRLSSICIRKVC